MFVCCSSEEPEALAITESADSGKPPEVATEETTEVLEAAAPEEPAPVAETVEKAQEAKELAPAAVEPAPAPASAPAQPSPGEVYSVTLDKSGGAKLGATVDIHTKDVAVIFSIVPGGIIDTWNKSCTPDKVIQMGDRLISVGGTGGDNKKMLALLTSSPSSLQVQFQRPREIDVSLPAGDRKVGLRLPLTASVDNVLGCEILSIVPDSRMTDWNDKADSTQVIKPDDRLYKVNGERVDGQAVQEALKAKASSALKLTFITWR